MRAVWTPPESASKPIAERASSPLEAVATHAASLWRERGVIAAADHALLEGPCGLAGHRVLGTLLHQRLLLLRVLAHETEPAMRLLRRVRGLWRHLGWGLEANEPRIWAS